MRLKNYTKSLTQTFKGKFEGLHTLDIFTMALVAGASGLVAIIVVTYFLATQQKLSEYVTPIPLEQKTYVRGELIRGFFKGKKIYDGKVTIVRQLSCNNGFTATLPDLDTDKKYFESVGQARTIDGTRARGIAELPDNVKPGASCIVAFNHEACIPYLFGCYVQYYAYVSLPFTVSDDAPRSEDELTPISEPKTPVEQPSAPSTDTSVPDTDNGLSPPAINEETSRAINDSGGLARPSPTAPSNDGVSHPAQPSTPAPVVPAPESTDDEPRGVTGLLKDINDFLNLTTDGVQKLKDDIIGT